jgi:hypothetical protein
MTPRTRTARRAARFQGADHTAGIRERRTTSPRIEREGAIDLHTVVLAFDASTVDGVRYVESIDALYEIGASAVEDRGHELRALIDQVAPTAETALHAVIEAVRQRLAGVPVTYAQVGPPPLAARPELIYLTEYGEREGWGPTATA